MYSQSPERTVFSTPLDSVAGGDCYAVAPVIPLIASDNDLQAELSPCPSGDPPDHTRSSVKPAPGMNHPHRSEAVPSRTRRHLQIRQPWGRRPSRYETSGSGFGTAIRVGVGFRNWGRCPISGQGSGWVSRYGLRSGSVFRMGIGGGIQNGSGSGFRIRVGVGVEFRDRGSRSGFKMRVGVGDLSQVSGLGSNFGVRVRFRDRGRGRVSEQVSGSGFKTGVWIGFRDECRGWVSGSKSRLG
ncbi:hypothetical protein TIFTF001_029762 [Ficus carica]|uniref:Uncharacterized protein n=1 Tax=Ficus carica TaxID=3494 RepID=A0AA88DSG0_FICCA|nr:hypothetical protein TIFTF001_029762 [Ficus carica]